MTLNYRRYSVWYDLDYLDRKATGNNDELVVHRPRLETTL